MQTDTAPALAALATLRADAIPAATLSKSTADTLRDTWTPGKLRLLLAVVGTTTPAIVTVDKLSGHTTIGTLDGVRSRRDGGDGLVLTPLAGEFGTNFSSHSLGSTITVLEDGQTVGPSAHHRLADLWSTISSDAVRQAAAVADSPQGAGITINRFTPQVDTVRRDGDAWTVTVRWERLLRGEQPRYIYAHQTTHTVRL